MTIQTRRQPDSSNIHEILLAINTRLAEEQHTAPGLLRGRAGDVLCAWYSRKVSESAVHSHWLDRAISAVHEAASEASADADLSDGITGIAWTFELLLAESEGPYNPQFNRQTDERLKRVVSGHGWNGELEYVMGLAGIAAYAARRGRQSGNCELYAQVIAAFERHAEWDNGCCRWATPEASNFRLEHDIPDTSANQYNLGLAHGICGITASLLPALHESQLADRAARMITGACDWMISQVQDATVHGSYFGSLAGQASCSRLGWCYGDLPIAITCIRAGRLVGRSDWTALGLQVARHAAGRDAQSGAVWDAGLCHGSAGLYLLFDLLYRHEPDPVFQNAAYYWLQDVFERFDQNGLGGFDTVRFDEGTGEPYTVPLSCFLSGYGGVGLCLTTAAGVRPDWVDGILLG